MKCHFCPGEAGYLVNDRRVCQLCGIDDMRRVVRNRLDFNCMESIKPGAYVYVRYRGPMDIPKARKYGRIIDMKLKIGGQDWIPGMNGHGPYAVFLVRTEDGALEEFHPEHLDLAEPPRLVPLEGGKNAALSNHS